MLTSPQVTSIPILEKWVIRSVYSRSVTRPLTAIELSRQVVPLLPKLGPKGKFSSVSALRLKMRVRGFCIM